VGELSPAIRRRGRGRDHRRGRTCPRSPAGVRTVQRARCRRPSCGSSDSIRAQRVGVRRPPQ
jgi:hypothetical protein